MAPQSPSTVLVVDDEEGIRDYLAEVLRFEGYQCRCFSESLAALAYLAGQNAPADLVLADIRMPGMNGIDLLREVKSRQPGLPVILVSGLYELALTLDALEAGADDYLNPDSHFSFDSANHRVASDAFIYAGWKALKALRRSTPNG